MRVILIIEKDEAARLLYADELWEEGFDVRTVGDVEGAMTFLEQIRPDLIVLDERLREQNGADIVEQIRGRYEPLPIILSTCFPPLYDANSSPYVDYVIKSPRLGRLKDKINTSLAATLPAGGRHPLVTQRSARIEVHKGE